MELEQTKSSMNILLYLLLYLYYKKKYITICETVSILIFPSITIWKNDIKLKLL